MNTSPHLSMTDQSPSLKSRKDYSKMEVDLTDDDDDDHVVKVEVPTFGEDQKTD